MAVDLSRVIFAADGSLLPRRPICLQDQCGQLGEPRELYFPRTTQHQEGQVTPRKGTIGSGESGDPITDTAEFVENARMVSKCFGRLEKWQFMRVISLRTFTDEELRLPTNYTWIGDWIAYYLTLWATSCF